MYTATDAGHAALDQWMFASLEGRDPQVEALSRLYFLGGTFTAALRLTVLQNIIERAVADEQRLAQLADMIDSSQVPERYRELAHYQRLAVEYGIRSQRLGRTFFGELAEQENDAETTTQRQENEMR